MTPYLDEHIIHGIRILTPEHGAADPVLEHLVSQRFDRAASNIGVGKSVVHLCSYGADVLAVCTSWSVVRGDFALVKT